jgi:hypothetical protein
MQNDDPSHRYLIHIKFEARATNYRYWVTCGERRPCQRNSRSRAVMVKSLL